MLDETKRMREFENIKLGICPYCHHAAISIAKTNVWAVKGVEHFQDIYICENCKTEWLSDEYTKESYYIKDDIFDKVIDKINSFHTLDSSELTKSKLLHNITMAIEEMRGSYK